MFGSLGNMAGLLKQAQQMGKQIKDLQEQMAARTFEGEAGAGAVVVTVNGKSEMVKVQIKPEAFKPEDRELVEDLVVAAGNAAVAKAKQAMQEEMGKITGGLPIPGGMQGLFGG